MFAQMLQERGLVLPDGTQVAPPGAVSVTAAVMIDPVQTFTKGDLSLPARMRGDVLVFRAQDEHRTDFRLADYGADPRVHVVSLPGNHVGLGGGYDTQGTAAAVLEGATAYLRNSGIELAPVPEALRFDRGRPPAVYTEALQTARNGDVLSDPVTGRAATVWRQDEKEKERIGVPVTAPARDPRDPLHRDHGLYALLQRRLPDASEDRLVQFTAACHMRGITDQNLGDIFLLESTGAIHFHKSWPPGPYARVDLKAPMPHPEEAMAQVQAFDQRQAMEQAQAKQMHAHPQQGPTLGAPMR
jgi:hypothetical protein